MKVTFFFFLTSFIILKVSDASKILMIFPTPAPSHYIIGQKLMHILADRGHDVTIIASYRDKDLPKNCNEIIVEQSSAIEKSRIEHMLKGRYSIFLGIPVLASMALKHTKGVFASSEVQNLLKDPSMHFDVVVIEEFGLHGLKYFAHHFKAPQIAVCTSGAQLFGNPTMMNAAPSSWVAMVPFNGSMTFTDRLKNTIFLWVYEIVQEAYLYPVMDGIVRSYFPDSPSVRSLVHNASLMLLNSHVSTNQPVPLLPNMIEIGGFHVDPPKKLPDDLQKFLDESKNGVVFFSMGSNLQSKFLPSELRDAILRAFSKLKENVLWKFEDESLPGLPKNVRINKWLPQQSVLAHPNVKLFITHGGLLSVIETIYFGKPIIGIPVFGDQGINMAFAEAAGYAVKLDFLSLNQETLTKALQEVLGNPKYAENAKSRSNLMHDRIIGPKETAAYWVEYVIRNGGTHFRTAALDLSWYELYSLDIIAAVLVVFVVFIYILRTVCVFLFCKKNRTQKKKVE